MGLNCATVLTFFTHCQPLFNFPREQVWNEGKLVRSVLCKSKERGLLSLIREVLRGVTMEHFMAKTFATDGPSCRVGVPVESQSTLTDILSCGPDSWKSVALLCYV